VSCKLLCIYREKALPLALRTHCLTGIPSQARMSFGTHTHSTTDFNLLLPLLPHAVTGPMEKKKNSMSGWAAGPGLLMSAFGDPPSPR